MHYQSIKCDHQCHMNNQSRERNHETCIYVAGTDVFQVKQKKNPRPDKTTVISSKSIVNNS